MLLKGIIEVLRGGIAQLEGDLGSRLVRVEQIATGQQQALFGKVAEDCRLEGLLKPALQFIFIQAHYFSYFGQAGRAVDPFIDQVARGDDLLLVRGVFYKDLFFAGSTVTGFGAQDEDLYAFREQEQLLEITGIAVMDDLIDYLLHGGIDGPPLIGQQNAFPIDDPFGKALQEIVGILGEPEEGLSWKLYPKGLQLKGPVLDGHVEILRVEDIVVAADEIEGGVELGLPEAIVTF